MRDLDLNIAATYRFFFSDIGHAHFYRNYGVDKYLNNINHGKKNKIRSFYRKEEFH